MTDPLYAARLARHLSAATRLAMFSDRALAGLLDTATPLGSGIGGAAALLDLDDVPVFVKRVPLTELELRPGHVRSTANLFDLPGFYQYGIGSAGFGAWRELAAHVMTTNWVLGDAHRRFPLTYHWRVLPGTAGDGGEHAVDLETRVAQWDDSSAVRARLEALRDSTTSLVLFLEHFPASLAEWLGEQEPSAYERVDRQLGETVAFLRDQGLSHFDAHFRNVLTDGCDAYLTDFGLALSDRFELSPGEADFLARHRHYDSVYVASHLVAHHVAERWRGDVERVAFVRGWVEGHRSREVPALVAALLDRHAPKAVAVGEFARRLWEESRSVPYPQAEFERLAGA